MALIAPDTYRLTVRGTIFSRPFANVFHVQKAGGTAPPVDEAADLLADAFAATFLQHLDEGLDCEAVDYVDLSSISGDSGTSPWTATPSGGIMSGVSTTPQVAALIRWVAGGTRAQRNGRTYLAGLPAAQVFETGLLASGWQTNLQDDANDFITQLQGDELILSVLSVVGDNGTPRAVSTGVCDPRVATQRRRNRG